MHKWKLQILIPQELQLSRESGHTLYNGYDGHFPSARRPVSDNRIQLAIARGCLVNADAFTDVLRKNEPFLRMGEFTPFTIAAEYLLVLPFKRIPVYVVIVVKRTGGRRERLHTLLKKPRTPSSSGSLRP